MLAAVYHGPEDLRVEQWPTPSPAAGEIVLRMEYASICATDLRIIRGAHRKCGPGTVRVPGHEVVATIAELGNGVDDGYHVGQRVFVAPNVGCGHCQQCRNGHNNLCADSSALGITMDGAFAEYIKLPPAFLEQGNVIPFDPSLDGAEIALAEPFACVLHGQDALGIGSGEVLLIMGSGPIGIMHVMAARAAGVKKIVVSGKSPERLQMAIAAGADRVVNIHHETLQKVIAAETEGRGADLIVVATGARQAMEESPALAAVRGRINLFAGLPASDSAISLDANLVHYKELIVTGTTGCSTADCRRSLEMIRSGAVDLAPLISARYSLDRAKEAIGAVRAGNVLKVAIQNRDSHTDNFLDQ
jgi:L-iditol 2-dehydrogenase